jgi:hypothetical protein
MEESDNICEIKGKEHIINFQLIYSYESKCQ